MKLELKTVEKSKNYKQETTDMEGSWNVYGKILLIGVVELEKFKKMSYKTILKMHQLISNISVSLPHRKCVIILHHNCGKTFLLLILPEDCKILGH